MSDWEIDGPTPPGQKPKRQKPKTNKRTPAKFNPQKRAKALVRILKEEHNFDVIEKILETYMMACGLPELEDQIKYRRSIERDLMAYCFPKLKSTETKQQTEQTVINFNIPAIPSSPTRVTPTQIVEDIQDAEIVDGN